MELGRLVTHAFCECRRWKKIDEVRAVESNANLIFFCNECDPERTKLGATA